MIVERVLLTAEVSFQCTTLPLPWTPLSNLVGLWHSKVKLLIPVECLVCFQISKVYFTNRCWVPVRRQRQIDSDFQASLTYTVSSKTVRDITQRNPVSKKEKGLIKGQDWCRRIRVQG